MYTMIVPLLVILSQLTGSSLAQSLTVNLDECAATYPACQSITTITSYIRCREAVLQDKVCESFNVLNAVLRLTERALCFTNINDTPEAVFSLADFEGLIIADDIKVYPDFGSKDGCSDYPKPLQMTPRIDTGAPQCGAAPFDTSYTTSCQDNVLTLQVEGLRLDSSSNFVIAVGDGLEAPIVVRMTTPSTRVTTTSTTTTTTTSKAINAAASSMSNGFLMLGLTLSLLPILSAL